MFCGKCGKSIEENSTFCPHCGTVIQSTDSLDANSKYSKIFIEPDEIYIGSLGNNYLNSFLTNNELRSCIALLSDKRIYLRGNMVDMSVGQIERYNIQKTIDLDDITGTGFIFASPQIWKLIVAIITAPTIIVPLLLVISFLKARNTQFFIEYAGGYIRFDASIYGLAESQDFEKQIRRAKNKLKER